MLQFQGNTQQHADDPSDGAYLLSSNCDAGLGDAQHHGLHSGSWDRDHAFFFFFNIYLFMAVLGLSCSILASV